MPHLLCEKVLAGQFPLLIRGPFVQVNSKGPMPCDLSDKSLIQSILIQLHGHCGAKGMIGVMPWQPHIMPHFCHGVMKLDIPYFAKVSLAWLKVECSAGSVFGEEGQVLNDHMEGVSIWVV